MDDQFVPAVEDENYRLKETATRVETKTQLTKRVLFIEVFYPKRPGCGIASIVLRDAVFEGGLVDLHDA